MKKRIRDSMIELFIINQSTNQEPLLTDEDLSNLIKNNIKQVLPKYNDNCLVFIKNILEDIYLNLVNPNGTLMTSKEIPEDINHISINIGDTTRDLVFNVTIPKDTNGRISITNIIEMINPIRNLFEYQILINSLNLNIEIKDSNSNNIPINITKELISKIKIIYIQNDQINKNGKNDINTITKQIILPMYKTYLPHIIKNINLENDVILNISKKLGHTYKFHIRQQDNQVHIVSFINDKMQKTKQIIDNNKVQSSIVTEEDKNININFDENIQEEQLGKSLAWA